MIRGTRFALATPFAAVTLITMIFAEGVWKLACWIAGEWDS